MSTIDQLEVLVAESEGRLEVIENIFEDAISQARQNLEGAVRSLNCARTQEAKDGPVIDFSADAEALRTALIYAQHNGYGDDGSSRLARVQVNRWISSMSPALSLAAPEYLATDVLPDVIVSVSQMDTLGDLAELSAAITTVTTVIAAVRDSGIGSLLAVRTRDSAIHWMIAPVGEGRWGIPRGLGTHSDVQPLPDLLSYLLSWPEDA